MKRSYLFSVLQINFFYKIINRFCLSDRWIQRFSYWVTLIEKKDTETLNENELNKDKYLCKKILIIRVWDINCEKSLNKQAWKIRELLKPRIDISNKTESFINDLPTHQLLVGIHARRGDYKSWNNGLYYYSWSDYRKWITELTLHYKKIGTNVLILICSDEKPPTYIYTSPNTYVSENNYIVDLYLLSSCKIILGPPSSFASWANFYGENKRIVIHDKNQKILSS